MTPMLPVTVVGCATMAWAPTATMYPPLAATSPM